MANDSPRGYVTSGTFFTAMIIALAVGFVSGVVYSAFKEGGVNTAGGMPQTAPAEALKKMAEALEAEVGASPENSDLWLQLGHTYFDAGEPEKAIRSYETALELKPDQPDVLTDLGVMYRRTGKPEAAVERFDQAIGIAPSHETARFNKGVVLLYDLKERERALEAWRGLLEINPVFTAPDGTPLSEIIRRQEAGGS